MRTRTARVVSVALVGVALAANARETVRKTETGDLGTTVWLEPRAAPFPFRDLPYRDSTVIAFVPRALVASNTMASNTMASNTKEARGAGEAGRVDVLLYFHGHLATADDALRTKRLREQLVESGRPMVLLVPQLARAARDSHAGRLSTVGGLKRLLEEVFQVLEARKLVPKGARTGHVELSAHSGGFEAAAMCVSRGRVRVRAVYLFDALYGYARRFAQWLAEDPSRRLVSFYRDNGKVRRWTGKQQQELRARRIPWKEERTEGELSRAELASARAVFIVSQAPHIEMPYASGHLRDCLASWSESWR